MTSVSDVVEILGAEFVAELKVVVERGCRQGAAAVRTAVPQ